jgi:hypothetical protein
MNNYPPGVTGNEPELTGEWECSCDHGLDGEETCPVCQGKGFITGEETYFLETYVCAECGEKSVTYVDDTDRFACERRCSPDAHWTAELVARGGLEI